LAVATVGVGARALDANQLGEIVFRCFFTGSSRSWNAALGADAALSGALELTVIAVSPLRVRLTPTIPVTSVGAGTTSMVERSKDSAGTQPDCRRDA
jgi:hypothetical protein